MSSKLDICRSVGNLLKILFYPAISLDGFIAKPDGDSSWVTKEDERLFSEQVKKAGCVIVGSRTFDQFKDIIYPITGATTFVCTSHDFDTARSTHGVTYVRGEVPSIVQQIQAAGFKRAILSGGGETNGRFAEAGVIDKMLVSIYPHLLGSGIPLFGTRQIQLKLELVATRQLDGGVIQNRYRVHRN